MALPIGESEHDSFGTAGRIFQASEGVAEHRMHAEHGQNAICDVDGFYLLRLGEAGDANRIIAPHADISKSISVLAVGEVSGGRGVDVLDTDSGGSLPDAHQAIGVLIRERLEQNSIDDAEDGGIRANGNGDSDKSNGSEDRGAGQSAKNLPKRNGEEVHHGSPL